MEGQIIEKNGKKYIVEKVWKPWESNASGNIIMGHEEHVLVPLKNSNSGNIKKDLEKKTKAQILAFYQEQGGEEDLSSLHKSDLIKIVVKHVKQILGENNNNNNNNGYQNYINELTRGGKKSRKYKTRKQKYRK